MSWKRLEDIFATRLQDVLKTPWRCLEDVFARRLEGLWLRRIYSSWKRHLEDVLKHLDDVLKTPSENEDERRLEDVFKTSLSRQMFAGWTLYSHNNFHNILRFFKKKYTASSELALVSRLMSQLKYHVVEYCILTWKRWRNKYFLNTIQGRI